AVDRADVDDAAEAARRHAIDHVAAQVEHAVEIDLHQLVPLLRRHLAQAGIAGDAGGVDQDVDAAVLLLDARDELPAAVEVAHIGRLEGDGAVEIGQLVPKSLDALGPGGQVHCNHLAAGSDQLSADFRAQSTDAAGDDGDALWSVCLV